MDHPQRLRDLAIRIRDGDPRAVHELWTEYGTHFRRIARRRLREFRLQRLLETDDLTQIAFYRFLEQISDPGSTLEDPDQALKLLAVLVRRKARDKARWHHRDRRDVTRTESLAATQDIPDPGQPPDDSVADREPFERVLTHLPPGDRSIVQSRLDGASWPELARQHNTSPDALRKHVRRLMDEASSGLHPE